MAPVVDVELRDGMTVRVRPVLSDDVEALEAFVEGLSPEARRQRFFGTVDPAGVAKDMAAADGSDHHGLVALTGVPERIVGHAHYVRDPTRPVAEAAFAVADRMQGQGLGTLLLAHLAERAHAEGIATFEAVTMRGNRRMVDMFRASGFPVEVQTVDGERLVRFPTSLSPAAVAAFEARERVAVAAMVRRLLAPASVVVVGASRSRGTVGGEVLHHLREGGYTGRLYAVNHSAAEVQGMPAYATVDDLPDPVDLAVIAVPGAAVLEVVRALRPAGGALAGGALGRVRRGGRRGCRAPARAGGHLPGHRHAPGGPQLPGRPEHRPGNAPQRDVRDGHAAGRRRGDALAERRPRHRPAGGCP